MIVQATSRSRTKIRLFTGIGRKEHNLQSRYEDCELVVHSGFIPTSSRSTS